MWVKLNGLFELNFSDSLICTRVSKSNLNIMINCLETHLLRMHKTLKRLSCDA